MEKIINVTEKPNSYEFGKSGNRHKIYYDTPEQLKNHMDELRRMGLIFVDAPIVTD